MNLNTFHWYLLIKLCRFLDFVGLHRTAWYVAEITGLKSRLGELLDTDFTD